MKRNRRLIFACFFTLFILVSSPHSRGDDPTKPRIQEQIDDARNAEYQKLPGGVFNAPLIKNQIKAIVKRFQASGVLAAHPIIDIFLASTPVVNAWVSQASEITDAKVFHLVVTKGLFDLISNQEFAIKELGSELAAKLNENSEGILAAVIGHEFGHAMNGDTENVQATTGMYHELNADTFGVKLLAASGYKPSTMILLFEAFEKLREDKSIAALISRLIDEHPQPRFRIANIQELVDLLESSHNAREQMGFDVKERRAQRVATIRRDGRESGSKNSVEAVRKKLSQQDYLGRDFREKLTFLEQYFLTSANNSPSALVTPAIVSIVTEYVRLLDSAITLDKINLVINSLARFEKSLGDLAVAKDSSREKNVKLALSDLKAGITQKQIGLLNIQFPEGLTLGNLDQYASHIDQRVLMGELMIRIRQAQSIEGLKNILAAKTDKEFGFQERFLRASTGDETLHNYRLQFFEKMALRALDLSKNLETTLNFMQDTFLLVPGNKFPVLPAASYIFGGLANYVISHKDVEFGKFTARMDDPKSAKDRIYSSNISANADESFKVLTNRRGTVGQGDPLSQSFRYGIGRTYPTSETLSTDQILLIERMLGQESVNFLFNDLIKRRYTIGEALDLLASRNADNEGFWLQIKKEMPLTGAANTERELEVQLRAVEKFIMARHPDVLPVAVIAERPAIDDERPQGVGDDLVELYLDSKGVLKNNLIKLLTAFSESPYFTVHSNLESSRAGTVVPQVSQQTISILPPEERVEVFDTFLRLMHEMSVKEYSKKVLANRSAYVAGIDELIKDGKDNEVIKKEFFDNLDELISMAVDFTNGITSQLPERFYFLKRKARAMWLIFESVGLDDRLPKKARGELSYFVYGIQKRTTISLLQSLLLTDSRVVADYLQNPTEQSKASDYLDLAGALAARVAYYDGISGFERLREKKSLSEQASAARILFHKGYITLDIERMAPQSERKLLVDLGPGFTSFLEEQELKGNQGIDVILKMLVADNFWSLQLVEAVKSDDPIASLVYSFAYLQDARRLSQINSEEQARISFILLMRSLEMIKTKEQMDLYASLFSLYIEQNSIGPRAADEFLNANIRTLMSLMSMRYREHFYNRFAEKLTEFNSWTGEKTDLKLHMSQYSARVFDFLNRQIMGLRNPTGYRNHAPLVLRIWGARKILPVLTKMNWYKSFTIKMSKMVARAYTDILLNRGLHGGRVDKIKFLQNIRANTPWSELVDEAIADAIQTGDGVSKSWRGVNRKESIELLKSIRSLTLRDATYRFILKKYGDPSTGYVQKLKNYWALYKAYREAEEIWTKEVLEELKQTEGLIAAFQITEKAWDEHAGKRATKLGVDKVTAMLRLKTLHDALMAIESPMGGEVAGIFPEASRHRDPLLEENAKKRKTTMEQLKILESFKSRNSESPYHKIVKAFFELNDEIISKLTPMERAQVALYLADFDHEMDPALEAKIKDKFYGTDNRRKALNQKGFYFTLKEVKLFFKETHVDEKLLAYRSFFIGGLMGHIEAEALLTNRLLMSDATMPPYLRKLLTIYLNTINGTERSLLLAWLLANGNNGVLKGPDVVRLLVEKGGVAAAKLAQLVASHGFKLDREYQDVLEVFKGNAQKVDKVQFMRWIVERMPADKLSQIKSLDQELGSGSQKIGYKATLKDGRHVVIMLNREYIVEKTAREFTILREVMTKVMADPELRIENLPGIQLEVERIIREEMKFKKEAELMKQHKEAYSARPLLVRLMGNSARVMIPQPLAGWYGSCYIVEEYVEAKNWKQLPHSAFFGWSQEKLAKTAITEILNQLLAYVDPSALPGGKVILDIDPHEENQLAQRGLFGTQGKMINIDLGQSVELEPEVVRGLIHIIFAIHTGKTDLVMQGLNSYMDFKTPEQAAAFRVELEGQMKKSKDPVEVFTKTVEETELKGITLKFEYLYFQKLFATLVGLEKSVNDPTFLTTQAEKILFLRVLSKPLVVGKEIKSILTEKEMPKGDCTAALLKL